MGILSKKIIEKRFVAGLTAILFIFNAILPAFSMPAHAEENPDKTAIETDIAAKSVSEKKVKELLRYLNIIDNEGDRSDFKKYLDGIEFKNDRLIRLKENLAYHTAMEFGISAKTSSLISPDFISLNLLNKEIFPNKSTYEDLAARIEREMNSEKLILRTIDSVNNVIIFLRDKNVLADSDKLKEKIESEKKLIEVLEKRNDINSYTLLAELKLEKRLTDFKIAYMETGKNLLTELTEYTGSDLTSLKDKTEKEEALLLLIEQLYTNGDKKDKILDPFFYNLLESYTKKDIDQSIIKNINILIHSETILKYFNADSFGKYSSDISTEIKNLNEILDHFNKKDESLFSKSADLFYKFLANKNQGYFSDDYDYNSHYALLKSFDSLGNIINHENFERELSELAVIHPFVISAKETLEKKIKDAEKEIIQIPDPVTYPVTDTKTVAESETTDIKSAPLPTSEPVKTEVSEVKEPLITDKPKELIKNDKTTEKSIDVPDKKSETEDLQKTADSSQGQELGQSIIDNLPQGQELQKSEIDSETEVNKDETADIKPANNPEIKEAVKGTIDEKIQNIESENKNTDNTEKLTNIIKESIDVVSDILSESINKKDTVVGVVTETETSNDEKGIIRISDDEKTEKQPVVGDGHVRPDDEKIDIKPDTESVKTEDKTNDDQSVTESETTDIKLADKPETETETTDIKPVDTSETKSEITEDKSVDEPVAESAKIDINPITTPVTESETTDMESADKPETEFEATDIKPTDIPEIKSEDGKEELPENTADTKPIISDIEKPIPIPENKEVTKEVEIIPASPEVANIIGLFRGEENIFEKVMEATQLIAKDSDVLYVDSVIDQLKKTQNVALLSSKILDSFQPKSQLGDLEKIVKNLGATDEEIDMVISLFNQFTTDVGYIDKETEFSGFNGIIRFGPKECPDLESKFKDQNINFCVSGSTDISVKNLTGYLNYTKEDTDKYQTNQRDIKIDWDQNAKSTKITMANGKYFTITQPEATYTMSVLHNPDKLFTSLGDKGDFEQIVVNESDNHAKNVVDIFRKDAHLITPKSLDKYIIYNYGSGIEKEEIKFENAVLYDKNDDGIEGYFADTDKKSNPDFIIHKPFALDKDNNLAELGYSISDDKKSFSFEIKSKKESYPMALNLQLIITSENQNYFNQVIDSESGAGNQFASAQTVGDFNGDLYDDLAIGSYAASGNSGRVDIYYYNESVKSYNDKPDVTLKGETAGYFGYSLTSGDINGDSLADLIVGSPMYNKKTGKAEIFYGKAEGLLSVNPDMVIKGAGEGDEFGTSLLVSDSDDGKSNLVIGAPADIGGQGIVHIFYNKSLTQSKEIIAIDSDIEIAGEGQNGSRFGEILTAGDFDSDKNTDIAISAPFYKSPGTSNTGRVYLFLQDKSPWTNQKSACGKNCKADYADTVLEGGVNFGKSIAVGDLNGDKKYDLAVGESGASDNNKDGRINIFYQDGEKWVNPDAQISGRSDEQIGLNLLFTDFNNDGVSDLIAGAQNSAYIFYGQKENAEFAQFTESKNADVIWDGEYSSGFGYSLLSGEFNGDKISDLIIGAPMYQNFKGRSYIFYGNNAGTLSIVPDDIKPADSTIPANPVITCDGFVSGISQLPTETKCVWDDTAGPSKGIYKYCFDTENKCVPDKENSGRSFEIKEFTAHHSYFRVQTKDDGGESEIISFDLAVNSLPVIQKIPSDGGSDIKNPTEENSDIIFTVTAKDADGDKYNLIACDSDELPAGTAETSDDAVETRHGASQVEPIKNKPTCAKKTYCTSDLTESGKEAKCSYKPEDTVTTSYDWHAFVCEEIEGKTYCSKSNQGTGAEGSPFYIKHPPKYGKVQITNMSGGEIEPGDRIKITLDSKEISNIPSGNKVQMFACSSENTDFDYEKNECVGGILICSSESTDSSKNNIICDERLTNPIEKIPTKSGTKNINVYVKYGEKGSADGVHKQSYEVKNINPTLIDYVNKGDINIPAGGSFDVSFSATIKDLNGWDDIKNVEGVFFDSDKVSNDCGEDNNNCYIEKVCDLTKIDDITVSAECGVKVFYNANAGKNWKVHIKPTDAGGRVKDFINSDITREVPKLIAINQEKISIPYKETNPGEVSGAAEVILTNLGNQPVDVLISGTDLVGKNSAIKKELQKWSTDSKFDYEKQGYPLVGTATESDSPEKGCANVTLPVTDNKTRRDVPIYWKIFIPKNIKSDLYEGGVLLKPTVDVCK